MKIYYSKKTQNGNISYSLKSQDEANARAKFLDDNGCINCINCINCTDCTDCTSCTGCRDCEDCTGCTGCTDCTDCTSCIDCAGIYELSNLVYEG